jgi:hypothetical protein
MIDFKNVCERNKLFYSNGRSTSDVKWINDAFQLLGLKINTDIDTVIKGDDFQEFLPEQIKRIEIELELRKRI